MPPEGSYLENVYSLYKWWASTCCIAIEDQKGTQLRFTEFLERKKNHAILPETEQIWNDFTWNVKVPEKDNFWTRITSHMMVCEKEKIGKEFTSNVKVPEKENYWKENMMVPEKDKSEKKHSKCESSWQGNFLKRTGIEYNRSWKGQIWKDFITSNVKVPEREIFWNKNHIIYDSSWQRKTVSINERKECNSGKRL